MTLATQILPTKTKRVISPQHGPQTAFLSVACDIVIYGGAAGGGKTWALLMEAARHRGNGRYRGVIFRRTSPQITAPGGLWDEASRVYPLLGAVPNRGRMEWRWPSGALVKFAHLQHKEDRLAWQGAQMAFIGWDELTHFDEEQFWYLLSRARSLSGVRPYIRATTNPAPGWVRNLIAPWVEDDWDGPGGPAASGEIRYVVRAGNDLVWVDKDYRDRLGLPPKSMTFIRSTVHDNRVLMTHDPAYVSNLLALPDAERRRLYEGDWNVFEDAFFDEWSEQRHCITPPFTPDSAPPLPSWWTFMGGLDWGWNSPFAFVLCAMDGEGVLHVIESVEQAHLTNEAQADKVCGVLSKWGVKPINCTIAFDPSMKAQKRVTTAGGVIVGEPDIDAFYRAGLHCVASDNNRQGGWSLIRRYLHKEGAFNVWRGYNGALMRDFPLQTYDKTDPEDLNTKGPDHLVDALRYALATWPTAAKDPHAPKPKLDRWQQLEADYKRSKKKTFI